MSQEVIKKIALLVFEKAKKELSNPTKNAICNHISDTLDHTPEIEGTIDSKTIKRVYEKFIEGKERGTPSEITLNYLIQYLGYKNYSDFINKSTDSLERIDLVKEEPKTLKKKLLKKIVLVTFTLFVLIILFIFSFFGRVHITSEQDKEIVVFVIDKNNQTELGRLTKQNGYQFNTWLSIGKTELYYYSLEEQDGKEYPGAEIIEVLPFWRSMAPVILSKI
ncbi:hypothetical protein [Aquimarina spinulae]|uniref:hypothetical protein n=1 Tax=Aquimarina spinulae TaxID=1192023 RepID=UPI000D55463B|nr:hypothetical protein [Aquimarina spinulae]